VVYDLKVIKAIKDECARGALLSGVFFCAIFPSRVKFVRKREEIKRQFPNNSCALLIKFLLDRAEK
jgi:hypothetical protein